VSLNIYRRHGKKCPYVGKPRSARNNQACKRQCSIWVEGTLGGEYIRRSLDLKHWGAATTLVRGSESEGGIGRIPSGSSTPPDGSSTSRGWTTSGKPGRTVRSTRRRTLSV
jgi:hypothetical protein